MQKIRKLKAAQENKAASRTRKKDPLAAFEKIHRLIQMQTPPGHGHFITFYPLAGGNGKWMKSNNTNPEALPVLLRKIADEIEEKLKEAKKPKIITG